MFRGVTMEYVHLCGNCIHIGKCSRDRGILDKTMIIRYHIEKNKIRNFLYVYECKNFEQEDFGSGKRSKKEIFRKWTKRKKG